jgi:hypothetical protein
MRGHSSNSRKATAMHSTKTQSELMNTIYASLKREYHVLGNESAPRRANIACYTQLGSVLRLPARSLSCSRNAQAEIPVADLRVSQVCLEYLCSAIAYTMWSVWLISGLGCVVEQSIVNAAWLEEVGITQGCVCRQRCRRVWLTLIRLKTRCAT